MLDCIDCQLRESKATGRDASTNGQAEVCEVASSGGSKMRRSTGAWRLACLLATNCTVVCMDCCMIGNKFKEKGAARVCCVCVPHQGKRKLNVTF